MLFSKLKNKMKSLRMANIGIYKEQRLKWNSPLTKILQVNMNAIDFYPMVLLFYFCKQMMFRNYNTILTHLAHIEYFWNVSDTLEVYLIFLEKKL